jgi:hypothetical protein
MSTPQVAPEKFVAAMREETEQFLQSVMQAVNHAPDGDWLSGSEEQVRDLSAEYRRQMYEKAIQMRIDAAEAAFPPSARSDDGQAAVE